MRIATKKAIVANTIFSTRELDLGGLKRELGKRLGSLKKERGKQPKWRIWVHARLTRGVLCESLIFVDCCLLFW